jgi:hypothetical protein
MALSVPQSQVVNCKKRFVTIIAGRRWGKTTLAIRQLCYHARQPNVNVWLVGPSYRSVKMVAWKPLKHRLLDLKWVEKINESSLEITLKNGSVISLKGSDSPDSLRGAKLAFCAIDEIADCDPDLFPEIIRPALADSEGGALIIGTPKGKNSHAYDLFCMAEDYPETWASFQFTTASGGFVSEAELEAARIEMDERTYRQEFLATWETFSGVIAYNFSREHNLKALDKPDTRLLHVGMDFNTSPCTAAIFVQLGKEMYQIDEIHMLNSNTAEVAEELLRRYPKSQIICYPDPAGAQRKTSAGGATDFTILRNAGFQVKAPTRHNLVRDRINSFNARLCSTEGIRYLYIDPRCKYTIESLEKYCYKEDTQVPDKGTWDHMFDAASYCIDYMFPIKRDIDPGLLIPQRWGHKLGTTR